MKRLLREGQDELASYAHPDPYCCELASRVLSPYSPVFCSTSLPIALLSCSALHARRLQVHAQPAAAALGSCSPPSQAFLAWMIRRSPAPPHAPEQHVYPHGIPAEVLAAQAPPIHIDQVPVTFRPHVKSGILVDFGKKSSY